MLNYEKMQYRYLGSTGLKVSIIGFGNMINFKQQNIQTDRNIIKICLQNGINFFDTAQMYQLGKCQARLGQIFKQLKVQRQHIVVSTKIWVSQNPQINSTRILSRKHIRQAVDKSLKRLQLDYTDILFAHAFQSNTSLQQICRAFHQVIQEGKSFYWGTSNWKAEHVYQAFAICQKNNLHKPVAAQNQYNMVTRDDIQSQYRSLFENHKYGTTFWSPLGGGFLTGKYLNGIPKQGDHRLSDQRATIQKILFYEDYLKTPNIVQNLKKIKQIAETELICNLHNLALAWVLKFKYTNTAIIGSKTIQQLQDNLKALELMKKITPQIQEKINKILGNNPVAKINFTINKQIQNLRPVWQ